MIFKKFCEDFVKKKIEFMENIKENILFNLLDLKKDLKYGIE